MTRYVIARDEAEAIEQLLLRYEFDTWAEADKGTRDYYNPVEVWEVQISAKRVETKEPHGKS